MQPSDAESAAEPAAEEAGFEHESVVDSRPIGRAALAYAVALFMFLIVPPVTTAPSAVTPLLRWGEILDFFTPVVLIPLAWLLFSRVSLLGVKSAQLLAFLIVAALWVEGHSLHLAANAIGHFVEGETPAGQLAVLLDEQWSHYIWHASTLALAGLIAWRSLSQPAGDRVAPSRNWSLVAAAAIYGLTFFMMMVEGGTAFFAVPGAILLLLAIVAIGRARLRAAPGASFVLYSHVLALALTALWAALNGGALPEFCHTIVPC